MPVLSNINKIFNQLKLSPEWSFVTMRRKETNYITHGYHRYPAKFIPHIVQKLISEYTQPGDTVVDPFGGCGTTLVEAKIAGRNSYGFDINPIAKLITQAKITPIKPKTLNKSLNNFLNIYELTPLKSPIINIDRISYWFDENTTTELNRIYSAIKKLKNYKVRRLYLCAFSHILKNCSRWLMKSTKPQIDPNKIIPTPFNVFLSHLRPIINRNNQFYSLLQQNKTIDVPTKMRIADSTKKLPIPANSVDLIITSPPYVTSYEYADLHQLSLLWFANDQKHFKKWGRHIKDFDSFRKKFIGTSIRKTKRKELLNSVLGEKTVARLLSTNVSIARSVERYFSDMNKSFNEMFRVLKPSGKACIIIGNTMLRSIEINNAEVATKQMQNIGFHPIKFIKREATNKMITPWRDVQNGKFTSLDNPSKKRAYEFEYILVMEKPRNGTAY